MSKVAEHLLLDAKVILCSLNAEICGLYFVPITFMITAEVLVLVISFMGKGIVI
jgi:hypothetical protein